MIAKFFELKRLGHLAAELGWPIEFLLEMPAEEVDRLGIVAEAWQDWIAEQEEPW